MSKNKKPHPDCSEYGVGSPKAPHISINYQLLDSNVWPLLSPPAIVAYTNILRKFNGYNAKEIVCPRDKQSRPLAPSVWFNATEELNAFGIVTPVRKKGGKYYNEYELCGDWRKIDEYIPQLKRKLNKGREEPLCPSEVRKKYLSNTQEIKKFIFGDKKTP